MNGEVHGAGIEPLTEHLKVTPGWSELKVKVALARPVIAGGPDEIVVSGSPTDLHA
jgi:hypothetical protein